MDAGEGFHRVECGGAGGDAVWRERGLRGGRDGFLRERVRQRFEGGIVVEREVDAFVGFDEDEDPSAVFGRLRTSARGVIAQGDIQERFFDYARRRVRRVGEHGRENRRTPLRMTGIGRRR